MGINYIEQHYDNYDEDSRLLSKHGRVEYLTTLKSYVPEIYNDGGVIPKERNSSFCFFVTSPMTFPT